MAPNSTKIANEQYILDAMSQASVAASDKSLYSNGDSLQSDDESEGSDSSEWSEDEEEEDTDAGSMGLGRDTRVTFAKTKKKYTTLDLDHYTEDEFRDCWYSSKEKKANVDSRDKLIARMEAGKRCRKDMTYRGLEAWTETGSQRLVDRVTLYIDTIMDEQDAQWDRKEEDSVKIAEVGLKVSSMSVQEALIKATEDHREALKCLDEVMSCSSESYDDDDFSVATVDLAEMRRRRNKDPNRTPAWGDGEDRSDPPGKNDDETASTSDMTEMGRRRRKRGEKGHSQQSPRSVADYRHDPPGTLDADVSRSYSNSLMNEMNDATRMTIDGVKKPKKKKSKKSKSKSKKKSKDDKKSKKSDKKKKSRRKSESSEEFGQILNASIKETDKLTSIAEDDTSMEKQTKRSSNVESPRSKGKDKISKGAPKSPSEKKRRSSLTNTPKSPSDKSLKRSSSLELTKSPPESADGKPQRRTSNGSQSSKKKSSKRKNSKIAVTFHDIEIRYYNRIIDINPAVTSGAAIGFDWNYQKGERVLVTDWEDQREEPREAHELVLSRPEREGLLKDLGFSQRDIAEATRNILKAKNQRRVTVQNLQHQSVEEAAEKAARKMKSFLFGKKS